MKKITLIALIMLLMCGCSSKDSSDNKAINLPPPEEDVTVTTDDVEDNSTVFTNREDVKYESVVREDKVPKEEQKQQETQKTNNNVSKPVKESDVSIPKVEEKPKNEIKIESKEKDQITNTDEKENNLVEVEEKEVLISQVLDEIKSLNYDEQMLIKGLYIDGKTLREMSEETGLSVMTLQNRKNKMLSKLKSRIL